MNLEIKQEIINALKPFNFGAYKQMTGLKITIDINAMIIVQELSFAMRDLNYPLAYFYERYYFYNSTFWEEFQKDDLYAFLSEAATRLGLDYLYSGQSIFIKKLLEQIQITCKTDEIRRDAVSINLNNGTLKIIDGVPTLRAFDAKDKLTYKLAFDFDPSAAAPRFAKFLIEVLPDEKTRNLLQEFVGYLFCQNGFLKLEKAAFLYGAGQNGKSVFFDVLTALLGRENTTFFGIDELLDERGIYVAQIAGKLVNYGSEVGSKKLNSDKFKKIVSGEPIVARQLYGQPFTLYNYAKLIFNCNELPVGEQSFGFYRRILIFPFDIIIEKNKIDRNLAKKIIADELPGVMNWAIDGLQRLIRQNGFSESEKVDEAVDKMRQQHDSVAAFFSDMNYVTCDDYQDFSLFSGVYKNYKLYCEENYLRACSNKIFSKRLEAFGVKRLKTGGSIYLSMKYNDPNDLNEIEQLPF